MSESPTMLGVVHGNVIQFDQNLGLPDGQVVSVTVRSVIPATKTEGLQASFGAWAEEAAEVDEFLRWNREQRKSSRS